jgi:hypothetical protein
VAVAQESPGRCRRRSAGGPRPRRGRGWTEPSLLDAVAAAKVWPAAERETPEVRVRSSAASIAARIGGAVHPVMPAKQTLSIPRPYAPVRHHDGDTTRGDFTHSPPAVAHPMPAVPSSRTREPRASAVARPARCCRPRDPPVERGRPCRRPGRDLVPPRRPRGADPGRDGTFALNIGSSWTVGPANPVGVIAELIWLVALMGRSPLWHPKSGSGSVETRITSARHETHPDRPN